MIDEIKTKLTEEVSEADWAMLEPHYKRDSLFIVEKGLSIVDVGVGVAMNKTQILDLWIKDNLVRRPTEDEVSRYEENKFIKLAKFLIVQPYVFIEILPSDS